MSENQVEPSGVSSDDSTMALLAHLLQIVTWFIGPLIIWIINKDKPEKAFVTDQAKEALNFSLTVTIAVFSFVIVSFILGFIPVIGWILGILLWLLWIGVGVGALVLCIIAALKAKDGIQYRYPFALRLIS